MLVALLRRIPGLRGIEPLPDPSQFRSTTSDGRRPMIRHVVLVRFREGVASGEISRIFGDLAGLRRHLPGMGSFVHGPNASPEGLSRGHTHAFTVDFEDVAARDSYLALPEHEAAGARLVKATEGGLAGVTVLDFEIP